MLDQKLCIIHRHYLIIIIIKLKIFTNLYCVVLGMCLSFRLCWTCGWKNFAEKLGNDFFRDKFLKIINLSGNLSSWLCTKLKNCEFLIKSLVFIFRNVHNGRINWKFLSRIWNLSFLNAFWELSRFAHNFLFYLNFFDWTSKRSPKKLIKKLLKIKRKTFHAS